VRIGLIFSVVLHILVFAAVFANFATGQKLSVNEPPPVPVEFITAAEFSEIKAGKRTAKAEEPVAPKADQPRPEAAPKPVEAPSPSPKPAPKEIVAAAPPPPPKPAPAPEPQKAPEAAPAPKAEVREEPKPRPEKKAEEPPRPKPKPAPRPERVPEKDRIAELVERPRPQSAPPQQSRFDADRIAALLNKDPAAGRPGRVEERRESWRPPSSLEEQAAGLQSGTGARMTMSELDALRAQIARCWSPPVGGLGGERIIVRLRIQMGEDGSILNQPRVLNREPSSYFDAAAGSAIRAVLSCQPYTLPAGKYDQWRDMILNFDPSQM
jgi:outer membrane biosynthesis protein TonB